MDLRPDPVPLEIFLDVDVFNVMKGAVGTTAEVAGDQIQVGRLTK